jgi:hypothetical protein
MRHDFFNSTHYCYHVTEHLATQRAKRSMPRSQISGLYSNCSDLHSTKGVTDISRALGPSYRKWAATPNLGRHLRMNRLTNLGYHLKIALPPKMSRHPKNGPSSKPLSAARLKMSRADCCVCTASFFHQANGELHLDRLNLHQPGLIA